MKNQQIYFYNQKLNIFNGCQLKLPVKINFYLQKNINTIRIAAEEIEKMRLGIGAQFGVWNDAQAGFTIPEESVQEANQELLDLFSLEQELHIHMFKLSDFENIELTYEQMSAIMFMIQEEE